MNNAVFGATMENLRNRELIDLVNTRRKLLKLAVRSSFEKFRLFHENLVALERRKNIILDKPLYVGFLSLDLRKTLM